MSNEFNTQETARAVLPAPRVNRKILNASALPFLISLACVIGGITLFFYQANTGNSIMGAVNPDDLPLFRFLIPNAIYLFIFSIAIFTTYIGYRLTVAAGATATPVIPAQDYDLLAPLVAQGKTEAIDQYVRLSSLTKFTGTFTQLGLTGLPLATIFLTLFFSLLTIFAGEAFMDLAKLTLGAFIGSFVQRQVERRAETGSEDAREALGEAITPRTAL